MNKRYSASDTTVVLLAAGQGKRMLPLTKSTPKPLLKVGDHALIEYHLLRLKQLGFKDIVINLAYLGEQIQQLLGDGHDYGVRINYSDESATGALETAGGIQKALPMICSDPFLVVNADIWTDYPFDQLLYELDKPARLVMVTNPAHNQRGDFSIDDSSPLLHLSANTTQSHTFSGIALYRKSMFEKQKAGARPLAPLLRGLVQAQDLEGEVYDGTWQDIGTPERLTQLNQSHKLIQ